MKAENTTEYIWADML